MGVGVCVDLQRSAPNGSGSVCRSTEVSTQWEWECV